MLYTSIIVGYTLANLALATVVVVKGSRNVLTQFYAFCVGLLILLGVSAYSWAHLPTAWFRPHLEFTVNFIYALFPFFFLHFVVLFVRKYELLRSKVVVISIYTAGIFGYAVILLGLIPHPLSDVRGITQSGYVFYLTWLTIFFAIGIAMLYEVARGFYEKPGRSNLLFISFALLLLILPGPFTESIFFGVFKLGPEAYFISCTIALALAVYFIFRHKIIVNTLFDALKSALAVLNDIFITTDDSFRIEMVRGTAIASLLGYSEKEMLGRPLQDFIEDGGYLKTYRHFVLTKKMKESYFDSHMIAKDGKRIPMNLSFTPMLVGDQVSGFVSIGRNMTEHKQMEEELRQAQKMESVGTLAGGVAHDINNILQIILVNTAGLKKRDLPREKIDHIIDINTQAVERGAKIVQQILTFARKTDIRFEVFDLNGLISEIVSMLSQTFPRTIEFSMKLKPGLPPVLADTTQINQMLLNLCVNARDAMPAGGHLEIRTEHVTGAILKQKLRGAAHEGYIHLSITDTGAGMDEATRRKIFEPFFTTKDKGKGTGMGLAVVHGVLQSHHGLIEVESAPGRGTTFQIYLPVQEGYVVSDKSSAVYKPVHGNGETILVVEDEDQVLHPLTQALAQQGYRVLTARDGVEGVEAFRQYRGDIALLILDIGLPKMNGWDMFLKMKELRPDVRAIISSGYLDPELKSEKLVDGVVDYIVKPYNMSVMLQSVRATFQPNGHKASTN